MDFVFELNNDTKLDDLANYVGIFTKKNIKKRNKFDLLEEYVSWLFNGQKHTTIRFRNDAIDFPEKCVLPLYESTLNKLTPERFLGYVVIEEIQIKLFSQINSFDAKKDGFNNLAEAKSALTSIYKELSDSEYVSIYSIKIKD